MKLKAFFLPGIICSLLYATCADALTEPRKIKTTTVPRMTQQLGAPQTQGRFEAAPPPTAGNGRDAGLRFITAHGEVRCGTDLSAKTYAWQDKDKVWHGFDVDLCKAFSYAFFGRGDRFKMVDVPADQISKALASNKIDIMFGNVALPAQNEINGKAMAADLLYYDKQMFLARPDPNASSMKDYKGSNVCVLDQSTDLANLNEFNRKYGLELNPLPFGTLNEAKQAFYLKRCPLFTGSELYLRGASQSIVTKNSAVKVLPEVLAYRPIYAYTVKGNNTLRVTSKWIINALKLAEQSEINSQNIAIIIGVTDTSTRNLLGDDPALWKMLRLKPNWVRKAVADIGNYGEIFERNLGKDSALTIERDKNHLLDKGGAIIPLPFM